VLLLIAAGQPVLIGIMSTQSNYGLLVATLLALSFVFGQIPITDAVLTRYVPDMWRAKVLSIKFMLNLMIGALALIVARSILSAGGGFDTLMILLAFCSVLVFFAALLLPAKDGQEDLNKTVLAK
jgi:hypothetical protein